MEVFVLAKKKIEVHFGFFFGANFSFTHKTIEKPNRGSRYWYIPVDTPTDIYHSDLLANLIVSILGPHQDQNKTKNDLVYVGESPPFRSTSIRRMYRGSALYCKGPGS